jgi:hypothetical protein
MRNSQSKDFNKIKTFLAKNGQATAAEIQKETKVKGNIYTKLETMVKKNLLTKSGKLYDVTFEKRLPLAADKTDSLDGEKVSNLIHKSKQIAVLRDEIDYIEDGIDSLTITKNYLERRLEQLEK